MIKIFTAILISLGVAGGTVAMAQAPAETTTTGTPSSTANIRTVREEPMPIPADAKAPRWWQLAREVGWKEETLSTLDYLIHRESRGRARAFNREDPNGGSRCLLQINGSWTGWLADKGIITKPADLFDPATCLTAGLAIYQYGVDRYGFGWGPWAIKP
jgi:soluble lytic murein transglycosylase-like protein